MAVDHVAGVLEPSEVTYHLLTSHSVKRPSLFVSQLEK